MVKKKHSEFVIPGNLFAFMRAGKFSTPQSDIYDLNTLNKVMLIGYDKEKDIFRIDIFELTED